MRNSKPGRFLVLLLIVGLLLLGSAQAIFAVEIDDNDPTAPAPPPGYSVMKVSPPENGTFTSLDGYLTVTIYDYDGTHFSWSSDVLVYMVYVKGGPEPGGIMYDYHPDGSMGDTGLSIPGGYEISHVTFYYKVVLTTSVTVEKVWSDNDNQNSIRPSSVSVQLKADGVDYETAVTLDDDNSWTHTWPELPKYDDGTEIAYTVEETPVPAGYTVAYSVGDDGKLIITNNRINNPSLAISKLVENVTQGFPKAELTSSIVGDTVRYTVVVTNNGNTTIADVYLTDDEALVGSPVEIEGIGATVWLAGPGGLAMVNLGDMDPGDSIQITYIYVVVAADLDRENIVNTATAAGEMLEVEDTAIVTVVEIPLVVDDDIPKTGESEAWPVWGIGLLLAALGLTIISRRSRKSEQNA